MFMDIFIKGLSFMSGTVKIAIQDHDSLIIESADKKIKLHVIDPSFFEIPLEVIKDNKMANFFEVYQGSKRICS